MAADEAIQSGKEPDRVEVANRLHSAAIHLLRHVARQDAQSRQGPARLSALSVLLFGGPMTLGQLASAERVRPPTMSRIVAGLKRSGLVRVAADAQDARRIRVRVTAKGERLLQEARRRRIQSLAQTLQGASEEEVQVLRQAAEIIERSLQRPG